MSERYIMPHMSTQSRKPIKQTKPINNREDLSMTYHELVEKVTEAYAKVDAKDVKEHIAVQYNVYGEGEGAFYIEISNGRIEVAPFEYYDRDAIIAIAGEALLDVVTAKTTYEAVEEAGRLVVVGNADKANKLMALSLKKAAEPKKTAVKKETAKKETAKKSTAKKTCAKKTTDKGATDKTTTDKAATAKATTDKGATAKTTTKTVKATESKAAEIKTAESKTTES